MRLFVTGTDTGVGKTYVTAGLLRAARAAGLDAVALKPFCCGPRDDAELLHAAAGEALTLHEVNPIWLRPPAAPYVAAIIENRPLDLALVRDSIAHAAERHSHVLVEGAGGWLVPITADYCFADLARELGWPVLVVAHNRLGALNHTLLTLESIRARGLSCRAVILNHPAPPGPDDAIAVSTNREILSSLTGLPVWELPFGAALPEASPWSELFG